MHTQPDPEASLSAYFESYVEAGKPGGLRYSLQHPLRTLGALRDLRALPVLHLSTSDGLEGRLVDQAVFGRPGWKALRPAVSVLSVPEDPADYVQGSSKQTLRRKMRSAQKAGVVTRPVSDRAERAALLTQADEYERLHARAEYRNEGADNSDLLEVRQWIGAFNAAGEPLMLSITPTDGAWGSLNYFRTFSGDPAATDTRYLMTKVLVDHLAGRGVRYLADTVHPAHLQNGLRHFQRMVGFRIHRVLEGTQGEGSRADTAAGLVGR